MNLQLHYSGRVRVAGRRPGNHLQSQKGLCYRSLHFACYYLHYFVCTDHHARRKTGRGRERVRGKRRRREGKRRGELLKIFRDLIIFRCFRKRLSCQITLRYVQRISPTSLSLSKNAWIFFSMCCLSTLHACLLSRVWLFVTLWTVAHQAPLSMGFFRQEYWSRCSFPPPGALPNTGIELTYPVSPTLQADF